MNLRILAKAAAISLVLGTTASHAATVIYRISGTGSGSLGSSSFTDANFTFTLTGDSSGFTTIGHVAVLDPLTTSSLSIQGLGATTLDPAMRLGAGTTGGFVFFSASGKYGTDIFDFSIPSPVDITQSFAPVTSTDVYALESFQSIASSQGPVSFTSSSNVTFSYGAAGVPEPAAWTLMLLGVGGLGAVARSRRRAHGLRPNARLLEA